MSTNIFDVIDQEQRQKEPLVFHVGDTVSVHVRIKEGDRERIQVFNGTVIARDGRGATETFTVRRISYGEGVERIFPLHSPSIAQIKVEKAGRVRRAKLYYLRGRSGKTARIRSKTTTAAK
jgi:large subunit ribosomal protein L19